MLHNHIVMRLPLILADFRWVLGGFLADLTFSCFISLFRSLPCYFTYFLLVFVDSLQKIRTKTEQKQGIMRIKLLTGVDPCYFGWFISLSASARRHGLRCGHLYTRNL